MPSRNRLRPVEAGEGSLLFLRGKLGRVVRIKANKNHFVVAAGVEGKHAQSADDAHLNLVAQHRAAVINEGQHHGLLLAEKLAKLNVAPGFVAEMQIERHLAIQRRLETDILQGRRHHGGGRADITRSGLSLRRRGSREQREDSENVAGLSHLLISSSPPKALQKKKANPSLRRVSS